MKNIEVKRMRRAGTAAKELGEMKVESKTLLAA